jgi:hypothetical protein
MMAAGALDLVRPMQALLDLVEADRARQCAELLGEARERAAAVHEQAHREARASMRQAFAEQRQRRTDQLAAAYARLATHRRLHEQQRTAALLALARQRLPLELQALWQGSETRRAWVESTLASARQRLAPGAWRVVHAAGWPTEECAATRAALGAAGITLAFEADPLITAGLKVVADGNVIDGTLAGLLVDRADFEARLLHLMEGAP